MEDIMKRANVAVFVPHLGCPHDCSFCNQRRISGQQDIPTPADVAATARGGIGQLSGMAGDSELAFFGGSFTAIEPALMRSLLEAAAPFVGGGGFKGIRVSTRPDAIDPEKLEILKKYGVTAIELGAQSMDDRVLEMNARGHTAQDVRASAGLIKAAGFELGLQMMTGLYGDTPQGALFTAREIARLAPATVRIYPTIVLRGTRLGELCESGLYKPQGLEEAVGLCAELLEFFDAKGIRVIRLGLHASEGIESGYVAGPWHPAFRELCENVLYLKKAREALSGLKAEDAFLLVDGACVSKLAGQHRKNLLALEKEFGVRLRIKGAQGLGNREVKAVPAHGFNKGV
jgi:histone acetyltransferase (RNA polymerase elongator complex component)